MSKLKPDEKLTAVFMDYRRPDGLCLAYHCVQCGYLYRAGHFGYECEGHVLCEENSIECPNCARVLCVPFLWRTMREAESFVANLSVGETIYFQFIPLEQLERAYVDLYENNKHLH